jgi:excinuclease ABC subunit C
MKSQSGDILYIGKASCLRKRVASYFNANVGQKTTALVENIADIEYIECKSQAQALILEAALIKEKQPRYNVTLKDDKSYPYVEVTADKFPRIFVSRPKHKSNSKFFGPYTQTNLLKPALNILRKVFPFRSCRTMPLKPCLFFHLKLCPAPCFGKISREQYQENIEIIAKVLAGERVALIGDLRKKMEALSAKHKFEQAAQLRDKLLALENLYAGAVDRHELIALQEELGLSSIPLRIEAIDISSIRGSDSVGSLVMFIDGVANKSEYRRYRIKQVTGVDDFAMIAEVVRRRYSRLVNENKRLPDLIIIDGGQGHVRRAKQELDKLGLNLAIIGIAKQEEQIWQPDNLNPLNLARNNLALQLIQRIRDEAHRFAHSYHVLRRSNRMLGRL